MPQSLASEPDDSETRLQQQFVHHSDEERQPPHDPMGLPEKSLLIVGGVIAPAVMLLVIAQHAGGIWLATGPTYQTDLPKDKLAFLLTFQALGWLYPLILFSMTAFTLSVVEIRYSGKTRWVRGGLWSGIPLGVAYHFVFISQTNFVFSSLVIYHLIPFVVVLVAWAVVKGLVRFCKDQRAAWLVASTQSESFTMTNDVDWVVGVAERANGFNHEWSVTAKSSGLPL